MSDASIESPIVEVHCAHDEMVAVADLQPHPKNPNKHGREQIRRLALIIEKAGWRAPIVVSRLSGCIVAGHGRLAAAQKLSLESVPVSFQDFASAEDETAYLLADNQVAELSEMDQALVAELLAELDEADADLDLTGFAGADLDELLADIEKEEAAAAEPKADKDAAFEPQSEHSIEAGQIYVMGEHRIACGDSGDRALVKRLLGKRKPAIMVTDPPYGVEYDPAWREEAGLSEEGALRLTGTVANDDEADWRHVWPLWRAPVAYVWHAGKYASTVDDSLQAADFEIVSQIIWAKHNFAVSRGDYHWQHEPCWYAVKKGSTHNWQGSRKESTVWAIDSLNPFGKTGSGDKEADHKDTALNQKTGHGTQKPVECMARPIRNNTAKGELVVDPFLGSGSTLIGAQHEGRKCFGCELNPDYVAGIIDRWEKFTGQKATLLEPAS